MEYKGFTARVEFDHDAGVLHGEIEGLRDVVTFESTDVRGVEAAFRDSVDDYLTQCAEDGVEPERPYSGKFLLRLDPRLHREIAFAAARAGRSVNALATEVFRTWIDRGRPTDRVVPSAGRVSEVPNAVESLTIPLYAAVSIPREARATSTERSPAWRSVAKDTPSSITPNTPPASNTPGREPMQLAS